MKKQKDNTKESIEKKVKNDFSYKHVCFSNGLWKSKRDFFTKGFRTKGETAVYFSDLKE